MTHSSRPFVAAVYLLLALSFHINAQSPAKTKKTPTTTATDSSVRGVVDPLFAERRANAISLINSLADEARGFHEETLRARVQARAADALWDTDKERARTLFRRAWDAADLSDRETQRREDEERRRQMQTHGAVVLRGRPSLRTEVLSLAARRDRALGEEFLARLDEARKQEKADAAASADTAPTDTDARSDGGLPALDHRLELARALLNNGDVERALQFADPALIRPTPAVIRFLTALREKNAEAADQRFASLLALAANDPATDANTVNRLSSYVFTPHLIIEVNRGGGYNTQMDGPATRPANFPASLRSAYLQFAAQILMRPSLPPDQDHTSAGRTGTYFSIARLLPLFEQYAPEKASLLRGQLAALSPDTPEDIRSGKNEWLTKGLTPDDPSHDAVQDELDALKHATSADERDNIYANAAFRAAAKNDPRARELAEKVSDPETRRQLLAFLDYDALRRAVEKREKDAEEILRLTQASGLTHIQRVFGLTEAARLLAKTDRARALETLDEAAAEARRIDGADADRARALLSVMTPLFDLDRARVWQLMTELVKTINALDDFNGEDGELTIQFRTKNSASIMSNDVPNFNLQPLFGALAKEDMDRAIELARSLNGEAPRAVATLAIARTILDRKERL